MALSAGAKQERVLFDYLRFHQHCPLVIEGDDKVRAYLDMKGTPKCADALGVRQPPQVPGPRRFTVAESKGTDMESAVIQLGNAAAGVYEKFGREAKVDLLLMVPSLQVRPSGALSPGHGYRAVPLQAGRNKFTLQESMGAPPVQARPRISYSEWARWSSQVASLRIVLLVLNGPDS